MENILVIRLKSIGDVVLTLPAVNALRENFPDAKITFLTSRENAPLLKGFAAADEVIALDRSALKSPLRAAPEFFRLLQKIRAGKFSLAVDFQGYGETAWLTRLTGAPNRWGSVYSTGRAWAYTRGVTRDDHLQIADFNLSLLQQCGIKIGAVRNEFFLPPESLAAARDFFASKKLDAAKPTLFIQTFTSSPHKNWPMERFLALAEHFRAVGTQVIFAGGPAEVEKLQPARAAEFVVAAGLPLLTAAGLMQLSTVIIGGVTGLTHIAVALQKRVVMLVGWPKIEPALPYQHRDWAVVPDDGEGTSNITLAKVVVACERAFSESAGNVSC